MSTRTIGTYELDGLLGEGGIGQVYAAQDKSLGRPVAIKMLRPELSRDRNFVDRFHVEAKSLGNLNHSNITTLYALHAEGEEAFMVMELVHGFTLEALLARVQRLTLRDSLAILAQTIAGIRYAHRRGVIHRDLKPANLMITDDGVVKIMDFGIARVQGSQHLTRVGEFCGTFVYASPEQIRGEEVDARSDLYSLAIVFYRMLAGTAPFMSDNEYALMTAQLQTPPPPLAGRVPDLDADTEAVLMRALAKRPEDRFASVEEFGRAVGAMALRGESIDILQQLYTRVFESDDPEATRIVTLRRPAADQTMPSNRPAPRTADGDRYGELPPSRLGPAPANSESQSNRSVFQLGGTEVLPSLPVARPAEPERWSSRGDFAVVADPPAGFRPAPAPAARRGGLRPLLIVAGALLLPLAIGGGYYAFVANGSAPVADSGRSQPTRVEPPPTPVRREAPPPPVPVEVVKDEPPASPPPPEPVEAASRPEPPVSPVSRPVEVVKTESPQTPPPASAESVKTAPPTPPPPAPVETAKTEPVAPLAPPPARTTVPGELVRVEPQSPNPPPPTPMLDEAKAETHPAIQLTPEESAKTEPQPVATPAGGVQVAAAPPPTVSEPGPSLGPEGEPDLQGRVTGAKGLNEIELDKSKWIKIYGIVDRAKGAQEAQHTEALVRYLKPSHNQIVCYRKTGDSYRCYSDGQDIARLALLDRLVQLAPNAPPEYRSLLAPRR
jgi:serine/threonine protein kinase